MFVSVQEPIFWAPSLPFSVISASVAYIYIFIAAFSAWYKWGLIYLFFFLQKRIYLSIYIAVEWAIKRKEYYTCTYTSEMKIVYIFIFVIFIKIQKNIFKPSLSTLCSKYIWTNYVQYTTLIYNSIHYFQFVYKVLLKFLFNFHLIN